jgi:tRNA_anti-like
MKKSKVISLVLLLVIVIGISGFNYVMHGGGRDLSQETTNFSVSSKKIAEEFTSNTALANTKYLEKAVAIKGIVTDKNENEIILDNGIVCQLKKSDTSIKVNQAITIKGRVVGYDDLMGEIKLDECFTI